MDPQTQLWPSWGTNHEPLTCGADVHPFSKAGWDLIFKLFLLKLSFICWDSSGGSRISRRGAWTSQGGVDPRGGYVSKILYVETKESRPSEGCAPGTPPRSANGLTSRNGLKRPNLCPLKVSVTLPKDSALLDQGQGSVVDLGAKGPCPGQLPTTLGTDTMRFEKIFSLT